MKIVDTRASLHHIQACKGDVVHATKVEAD